MKKQIFGQLISSSSGILALVIPLVFVVISGCGSDSKQSSQQVPEKAKPVIDKGPASTKIVEMPQGKEPLTGKKVKEEGSKSPTALDKDQEIFPPSKPGQKGMTLRDVERSRTLERKAPEKPVDPFPPKSSGTGR